MSVSKLFCDYWMSDFIVVCTADFFIMQPEIRWKKGSLFFDQWRYKMYFFITQERHVFFSGDEYMYTFMPSRE